MELLLIIFGTAVFGGLSLLDLDNKDESLNSDSETELSDLSHDGISELDASENEEDVNPSNPLSFAVEGPLVSSELPSESADPQHPQKEPQGPPGVEDLVIYDGVSDSEMGYTDKSFGISHRFYENDVTAETLVGGEGDDLIYAGAGSTANGGEGSDDFEFFLPDSLFGQEVLVVGDFEPTHETLTILLEQSVEADEGPELPEVELMPDAVNDSLLRINGATVASLKNVEEKISVALSVDGHGEVFLDLAGKELSTEELDQTAIRIVYLTDSTLFGL